MKKQKLLRIIKKLNLDDYSFSECFIEIVLRESYNIRTFLHDVTTHGCICGMIAKFVPHKSCKEFYINHIDDLERFKSEMEENYGEFINNRKGLPHYTFMVWLCFEEFCYIIFNEIYQ